MIILDTNVISELMKVSPDQQMIAWLNQQDAITLFVTSVSIAEITYGLNALTSGQRRKALEDAFEQVLLEAFKHRMLSFDKPAAYAYGQLMAQRKSLGRPMSVLDGQIAAISKINNMSLATRNTRDFLDCDIHLINPFAEYSAAQMT